MKLRSLLILALLCLAALLSAQATNLIISEYVEGTSYNKALEIYNGTGTPVDLSTVSLKKQTNGAGAFGNELVLSGTLANDDVYVIVSSATGGTNLANQPFVDLATTSQVVNFNGNDAVALYRNGTQIDVVGIVDQVDIWGAEVTWVRNSNIASPTTTFNMAEWTEYPQNTFSYLGDHTFTGGTTDPTIIVTNPNTAVTWYLGQTYNITWSSSNVVGEVSIGVLNGDVLDVIESSVANTGSYTVTVPTDYATGNQFKVRVAAVNGTASDDSDAFFTVMALPVLNSLAELRNSTADGTSVYHVNGNLILTYQQTYRNKKWFQDSTGAIEIDDVAGVITTLYQIGDAVPWIAGTLNMYHNMLQFTPYTNFPAAISSGNQIDSPIVTINELNSNFEPYESKLVRINDVTFLDTSTPFATGMVYNISDATGQGVFRTNFFEADYIGQPIPTTAVDMLVITTQYDAVYQVTSRSMADFNPVSNQDEILPLSPVVSMHNYPNPFTPSTTISIEVKAPQTVEVEIYNTKGQLIRTLHSDSRNAGVHTLVWDAKDTDGRSISAGVYLYNVKGGKFTSSKKMILLK